MIEATKEKGKETHVGIYPLTSPGHQILKKQEAPIDGTTRPYSTLA